VTLAGVDSLSERPLAAMKWLWRLPAASVVGMLLLISLSRTWWQGLPANHAGVLTAGVVLVAASYAYLLLEVKNHGVSWQRGTTRAGLVLLSAAAHSYLVATISLNLVAGAFMDGAISVDAATGTSLRAVLADPNQYLWLVGASTAWCIATGVFSQILWDDRPVTAPLAHMQWKKGG